jgi:hypothetical protein
LVTGRDVVIENIRAGHQKPGLSDGSMGRERNRNVAEAGWLAEPELGNTKHRRSITRNPEQMISPNIQREACHLLFPLSSRESTPGSKALLFRMDAAQASRADHIHLVLDVVDSFYPGQPTVENIFQGLRSYLPTQRQYTVGVVDHNLAEIERVLAVRKDSLPHQLLYVNLCFPERLCVDAARYCNSH